jgi:hypothetical protein
MFKSRREARGLVHRTSSRFSGKPWSEMDIRDLKVALQYSRTVAEIADFLCRDVEEVEAKIAELRRQ